MTTKIPLYIHGGRAYIWNAEDWYKIRSEHRICGSLIGAAPSFPRQNDFLGLPMVLMSEEAALLVEKGICELYELPDLTKFPTQVQKEDMKAFEEKVNSEQEEALKQTRIEKMSQMIECIFAGKKKKMLAKGITDVHLDKEELLQEEINKLPKLSPDHFLVHVPTESFLNTDRVSVGIDVLNPSVLEGEGAIKYDVFRDLWERNYHITSGSKFGSDYLVYPGDPVKFHATYMVRCIKQNTPFNATNYVAFGRLAVAVNKLAVYAYCSNNKIEYQTLQWHDSIN